MPTEDVPPEEGNRIQPLKSTLFNKGKAQKHNNCKEKLD
jgi:hypothetical protein